MAICENFKECMRNKDCVYAGYVSKVVNTIKEYEDIHGNSRINNLAGKLWLERGGGNSTPEQQTEDTIQALRRITMRVCREVKRRFI